MYKILNTFLAGIFAGIVWTIFALSALGYISTPSINLNPKSLRLIESSDSVRMFPAGSSYNNIVNNLPKFYVVQSGSMEPAVKIGSIILVLPQKSYEDGNIITFSPTGSKDKLVTHRLVVDQKSGDLFTKGDANDDYDNWQYKSENVSGKVVLTIPYVGYAVDFAKKPQGFLLLVIIPATIIIYEEIKKLKKELKKILKQLIKPLFHKLKLSPYTTSLCSSVVNNNDHSNKSYKSLKKSYSLSKSAVTLPLIGAFFISLAVTGSYFFDIEKSIGNILSAAADFGNSVPTPITKMVVNEVYYDPDSSHMLGGNPDEHDFEWIELYNSGNTVVNIKNWKITDNSSTERTVTTSNHNLSPGEFVILSKASNTRVVWGIPPDKFIEIGENFGNGLANDDDRVILKDNLGNIIDMMSYGGDTTAYDPSSPDVIEGHSLERNPDGTDTNSASDFVDRTTPTPGL